MNFRYARFRAGLRLSEVFTTVLLASALCSCSFGRELSRDQAARFIESTNPFKLNAVVVEVHRGNICLDQLRFLYVKMVAEAMARDGLLSVTKTSRTCPNDPSNTIYQLASTNRGKRQIVDWGGSPDVSFRVPVETRKLLDVTGITTTGEASRVVEFKWAYVADHYGNDIDNSIENRAGRAGVARFQRYDDGWRVQGLDMKDDLERHINRWQ